MTRDDPCEKELQEFERAFKDYVGYYRTVVAVHNKFKPEFVEELQRLDQVLKNAQAKWLECVNKTYLDFD